MKRLIAVLLTTIVFLLSACGKETAIAHFSTKEEALEHFIQNEGIRGLSMY